LIKRLITITLLVLTAGCSSTNGAQMSCDFVEGAYNSQRDRESHYSHWSSKEKQHNDDIINGLLSVISGSINRSLSDEENINSGC